jgi:hypothetical protein
VRVGYRWQSRVRPRPLLPLAHYMYGDYVGADLAMYNSWYTGWLWIDPSQEAFRNLVSDLDRMPTPTRKPVWGDGWDCWLMTPPPPHTHTLNQ